MATVLKLLQLILLVSPILAGKNLDFYFDKLEVDPVENKVAKVDIKLKKTGSNQFLVSGIVHQLAPLDDKWQLEVAIQFSPTGKGAYADMVTMPKIGVCKMMKTFYKDYVYEKLKKVYSKAPSPSTCPVAGHKYDVKDYPLDIQRYEEYFFKGFFKVTLKVYNGNKQKASVTAYAHVQ